MQVKFINNAGNGWSEDVQIDIGTTVEQFFKSQMGEHAKTFNYIIRVNREAVGPNDVLKDGDRVTISPMKVEGG